MVQDSVVHCLLLVAIFVPFAPESKIKVEIVISLYASTCYVNGIPSENSDVKHDMIYRMVRY